MKLKVSFCIPTYNRYHDLVLSLNSILSLDGLNNIDYEILISDDNSKEETVRNIKSYIKGIRNPRIRFFANKAKGQFGNLNNLYKNAKNTWLVFLHDDDLLHKDYLKYLSKVTVNKYSEVGVFFADRSLIDKNGAYIKVAKNSNGEIKKTGEEIHLLDANYVADKSFFGSFNESDFRFTIPMVTGMAVKREVVDKIGGFDDRLYVNSDSLFIYKTFFTAKKALYIDKPLVCYRVVDNSERVKPSEKGIVYSELKDLCTYTFDFLNTIMPKERFEQYKKEKINCFYKENVKINSPIMWVALRYKGSYFARLKIIYKIAIDIFTNYKKSWITPSLYAILLIAHIPQNILRMFYKVFMEKII